ENQCGSKRNAFVFVRPPDSTSATAWMAATSQPSAWAASSQASRGTAIVVAPLGRPRRRHRGRLPRGRAGHHAEIAVEDRVDLRGGEADDRADHRRDGGLLDLDEAEEDGEREQEEAGRQDERDGVAGQLLEMALAEFGEEPRLREFFGGGLRLEVV